MPPSNPADGHNETLDGRSDPLQGRERASEVTTDCQQVGGAGRPTISDQDGGASRRLARRCRIAASVLLVVGAGLLLVVTVRAWDAVSAMLTLVAGGLLAGAAILVRRGAQWSVIRSCSVPAAETQHATVGTPRPLSPGRPGAPIKRRLGASVVAIHAPDGPQPGGGALVVHARGDGVAPIEGDDLRVWRVGRRGLETIAAPTVLAAAEAAIAGRFVLFRESDRSVFLGTTRFTDTW